MHVVVEKSLTWRRRSNEMLGDLEHIVENSHRLRLVINAIFAPQNGELNSRQRSFIRRAFRRLTW